MKGMLILDSKNRQIEYKLKFNNQLSISYDFFKKNDIAKWALYDVIGNEYSVVNVVKVRWSGLFGFNPLYKGRGVVVRLVLKEEQRKSLDEMKSLLYKFIIKNPSCLGTGKFTSDREIKSHIMRAISFKSLYEIFA